MADIIIHSKTGQSHMSNGKFRCDLVDDSVLPAHSSGIAGTWVNRDDLAYGQLQIRTFRFDDKECEVMMDCTLNQTPVKFLGFYYAWPNERYYLVLQKAENGLQEHYMFVSLHDSPEGSYLLTDMTGSIRYTRS